MSRVECRSAYLAGRRVRDDRFRCCRTQTNRKLAVLPAATAAEAALARDTQQPKPISALGEARLLDSAISFPQEPSRSNFAIAQSRSRSVGALRERRLLGHSASYSEIRRVDGVIAC